MVDQLFAGVSRWEFTDPLVGDATDGAREWRDGRRSHRVPRPLAAAIEVASRPRPSSGWRIQTRVKGGRGTLVSERVLNLETCARAIDAALGGDLDDGSRRGVVLGHESDRRQMALLLREAGYRVFDAGAVARLASGGPRELLAIALLLLESHRLTPARRDALCELLLLQTRWAFPPSVRESESSLRIGSDGPRDLRECFVAALEQLSDFVRPDMPVVELARTAVASGLLEGVQRRASSRSRLDAWVRTQAGQRWTDLRLSVDPAAIADPLGPSDAIWTLRPADLPGLRFDQLFHVCSGFESAARHILVAGRADRQLTVLYSERDPFEG